jgi:hypothetical protein
MICSFPPRPSKALDALSERRPVLISSQAAVLPRRFAFGGILLSGWKSQGM